MAEKLFSKEEKQNIVAAIKAAELQTSGEIQVHLESHCKGDVLDRAADVFAMLKMHKTKLRNGVLFYLAVEDHKFAVLGDGGINAVVPKGFWDEIKEEMVKCFKEGKFTEGLVTGIKMSGKALKEHFPYDADSDENELSDEISFG
ncbi:TPM domain-containing protein [Echinicola vietnamensis]|uniref:Putative membrane protein n=1 Tax=Echinicola vietnamensis (strain DSM 17526 / LMG 23754 / KMM 6221) TaxID=926556 RepID=L0FXF9_ECHVK|nr:TPM domain-containing protein [Echinicola vietnamensis]AGA77441.1 putative membrane protein [Echinicola vietnamensis DSM 17526]